MTGEDLSLELRGSFGMATFPEDGTDIESIIKAADDMMYHVKGTTRDNLAIAGLGNVYPQRNPPTTSQAVAEVATPVRPQPSQDSDTQEDARAA